MECLIWSHLRLKDILSFDRNLRRVFACRGKMSDERNLSFHVQSAWTDGFSISAFLSLRSFCLSCALIFIHLQLNMCLLSRVKKDWMRDVHAALGRLISRSWAADFGHDGMWGAICDGNMQPAAAAVNRANQFPSPPKNRVWTGSHSCLCCRYLISRREKIFASYEAVEFWR